MQKAVRDDVDVVLRRSWVQHADLKHPGVLSLKVTLAQAKPLVVKKYFSVSVFH